MKAQQPALSCLSPQLAGTLSWTAAAPEGNLLPETQNADDKLSAAFEVTLTTSLSPPVAFESIAVAQQLVAQLSEQPGVTTAPLSSQAVSKEGFEGKTSSEIPAVSFADTRDTSSSPSKAGPTETGELVSQPSSNEAGLEAEALLAAAAVERPTGIAITPNPQNFISGVWLCLQSSKAFSLDI